MPKVSIPFIGDSWDSTLPETNTAPENGWLEYYFPIGDGLFSGDMLVSRRVDHVNHKISNNYLRIPY